jgi:hypothetical protein
MWLLVSGFQNTQKQHTSAQLNFYQPRPQPTYKTNLYTRKYKRLQLFLYLSDAGPGLVPCKCGQKLAYKDNSQFSSEKLTLLLDSPT